MNLEKLKNYFKKNEYLPILIELYGFQKISMNLVQNQLNEYKLHLSMKKINEDIIYLLSSKMFKYLKTI